MSATHVSIPQPAAQAAEAPSSYNYALGYLRGFIVALVVAHHAALAYHRYAPPPPASLAAQPRWWQAFPVVDPHRGDWAALFTTFNDAFFMALMFFLSGLFVWSGLRRKGAGPFLRGRLLRLGLPFLAAAALVSPLAYYPTYLQMPGHTDFAGFLHQWFAMGAWPSGPAWFIWVLLVFDCVAALLLAASDRAPNLGRFLAGAHGSPARFFLLLLTGSALVYLPMELAFNGLDWTVFGPFTFQTSRILHYLLYFLAGVGVGAWGLERGPLVPEGQLARRWPLWAAAAALAFVANIVIVLALLTHLQSRSWRIATDLSFVVSCALSSFAFLALFLRFARRRSAFFQSLSRNSYGIYLVHYAFVSWLQLAMLPASMPALFKFAVVTATALAASWLTTSALRRIPAVARVV